MLVVCVNAGNYLRRGREYVEKLYRGVAKHLSDFEFICFTDDPEPYAEGIHKKTLPVPGLHGWYHKLALFKPGVIEDGERILFLDLDTVIAGSLETIVKYGGKFAMLGPFFANVSSAFSGNQSGVMLWRAGATDKIWHEYASQGFPVLPGGDQAFINSLNFEPDVIQEMFPGLIMSFKAAEGRAPDSESIVCFHGLPRPHQCGGWVKELWI